MVSIMYERIILQYHNFFVMLPLNAVNVGFIVGKMGRQVTFQVTNITDKNISEWMSTLSTFNTVLKIVIKKWNSVLEKYSFAVLHTAI
jgi:hypothetical protein